MVDYIKMLREYGFKNHKKDYCLIADMCEQTKTNLFMAFATNNLRDVLNYTYLSMVPVKRIENMIKRTLKDLQTKVDIQELISEETSRF